MTKKMKIETCLDCGHHVNFPDSSEVLCNNPKFVSARRVDTVLSVKMNEIIPKFCPLDDWEE